MCDGRTRFPILCVLVLAIAFFVYGGCNKSNNLQEARFEPGPCPQLNPPQSSLKNAKCGQLVVPEDRDKNNWKTIRLNVAIIPAVAEVPAPDPIVYMVGGPGGAALPSADLLVEVAELTATAI